MISQVYWFNDKDPLEPQWPPYLGGGVVLYQYTNGVSNPQSTKCLGFVIFARTERSLPQIDQYVALCGPRIRVETGKSN